ncbi:MAG: rod shape-determining protein RodA [Chloroflexota bacterium]|nr:rod shape-determining protein RodA [Chloroflexota bacterium]
MIVVRKWKLYDYWLTAAAIVLGAVGIVLIRSATLIESEVSVDVMKQTAFLGMGVVILAIAPKLNYRWLGSLAWIGYGASVVMLLAVLIAGVSIGGSQRWFLIGPFSLQPSEFAKIALIVVLAHYFSAGPHRVEDIRYFFGSIVITAVPAFLVFREPDLGTTLMFLGIWGAMVFMAGVPFKYIIGVTVGLLCAVFLQLIRIKEYMWERITTFLDPTADPLGAGYNALQAQISVGAGELWGRGLFQGSQTQLEYLRVQHKDFVFAVLAEELGFVGSTLVLVLFAVLLMRATLIATSARDHFGQNIAVGVTTFIFLQTFVNVGMIIGLLPVTGIPLPFLSYGGSALITTFIGIGLLQSIAVHRRVKTYAMPPVFHVPARARLRLLPWKTQSAEESNRS